MDSSCWEPAGGPGGDAEVSAVRSVQSGIPRRELNSWSEEVIVRKV